MPALTVSIEPLGGVRGHAGDGDQGVRQARGEAGGPVPVRGADSLNTREDIVYSIILNVPYF